MKNLMLEAEAGREVERMLGSRWPPPKSALATVTGEIQGPGENTVGEMGTGKVEEALECQTKELGLGVRALKSQNDFTTCASLPPVSLVHLVAALR